jgi:hypothetical protein
LSPPDGFRLIAPANKPFCCNPFFFGGGRALLFEVIAIDAEPAAFGGEPDVAVEGKGGAMTAVALRRVYFQHKEVCKQLRRFMALTA